MSIDQPVWLINLPQQPPNLFITPPHTHTMNSHPTWCWLSRPRMTLGWSRAWLVVGSQRQLCRYRRSSSTGFDCQGVFLIAKARGRVQTKTLKNAHLAPRPFGGGFLSIPRDGESIFYPLAYRDSVETFPTHPIFSFGLPSFQAGVGAWSS